jgi:hypothetical protein
MILISLSPYATLKKIGLLVVGLICLSSVSCFAGSLLLNVAATPYDRQMTRIRPVLFSKASESKQEVSLGLVNQWMGDLRGIPYGFSQEWKTPHEVYFGGAADCKGKAVALYEKMHEHGAENVRLVIGRRTASSAKTHAWLEWNTANGTYILDPVLQLNLATAAISPFTHMPAVESIAPLRPHYWRRTSSS